MNSAQFDGFENPTENNLIEIVEKYELAKRAGVTEDSFDISDGYHTFTELYLHRNLLFLAFLYSRSDGAKSWRSRTHADGSSFDGWFIVGTELVLDGKTVQISYHMPDELWDSCEWILTLDKGLEWDGHTSADVVERLGGFLKRHERKQ
jgi:hypothetical protein